MAIALSVTAVTQTGVTFGAANHAADGTVDIQISIRPDFKFCVCPIVPGFPRDAAIAVGQLNAGTSFYARARSRLASGVPDDWSNTVMFRTTAGAAQDLAPAGVMIQPALLVVPNPVLEWTCATAVAGFPVENLGLDAPVAFRSISVANVTDIVARMAPEPVDTLALLVSNLPEAATVRVYAGPTNATAAFDTGALPFRASPDVPGRPGYHGLVRLPAAQAYEYWKVRITATTPGSLVHLEHLVFGLNRHSKNHSLDRSETGLDLGSLERTRSGIPNRISGYRMRRADFDISMMTEAQYETQYGDLHWKVGGTSPVLCAPNSKAGAFLHDRLLYGAISAGRVVNPASPFYTRNFTIDSLI